MIPCHRITIMISRNGSHVITPPAPLGLVGSAYREQQHAQICILFDLILYVPVNNFSVMLGWVFLCWTSTKQGLICLSQGYNAVTPVRLEPTALLSQVLYHWATQICMKLLIRHGYHQLDGVFRRKHAPTHWPLQSHMTLSDLGN